MVLYLFEDNLNGIVFGLWTILMVLYLSVDNLNGIVFVCGQS